MPGVEIKVLVLGASGMMGHTMLRLLADSPGLVAAGTVRSVAAGAELPRELQGRLRPDVSVEDFESVRRVIERDRPDVVINCIGVVKQLASSNDPIVSLAVNSLFPHQLAKLLERLGGRLIHFSTDCVFDGKGSRYKETDFASADDLYGRSKFLGETAYANSITLRTSIVGHELYGRHSLLEWFLAQRGTVFGYRKAIFSGLTTFELARVVRDKILPRPDLHGVYHLSSEPIDKYRLLLLFREVYDREIAIEPDDSVVVDRSLDSSRFRAATGYAAPTWIEQVRAMRRFG